MYTGFSALVKSIDGKGDAFCVSAANETIAPIYPLGLYFIYYSHSIKTVLDSLRLK